jgi:N-acetylglutamate synthase-like GNAT family acetyltransferase
MEGRMSPAWKTADCKSSNREVAGLEIRRPIIRQCREEDLPFIHELQRAWQAEGSSPGYQLWDSLLELALGEYFLVAEENAMIVGYTIAQFDKRRCFVLQDLYVNPRHRDGVGGALLTAILSRAKQNGLTRCAAVPLSDDPQRLERFYERHGFQWANLERTEMFVEL